MKAHTLNKKYFFLISLPRTGNTLLASLLNQNKKIAVTPNSIIFEIALNILKLKEDELFLNYPDHESLDNILINLFNNYYSHWKQEYIITRSLASLPGNKFFVKKYLNQNVKYIVLVRDLLEILSSYLKWANDEHSSFLNRYNTIEEKINFLMKADGMIAQSLNGLQELFQHEKPENFCLIRYNDLVKNPKYEINRIYKFLNIEEFEHRFFDIDQIELNGVRYNDEVLGNNLHKVKQNFIIEDNSFVNLIPDIYKKKYGHIKF